MMKMSSRTEQVQQAQAALRVGEAIASLGTIATARWADDAAKTLLAVRPDALIALVIAERDAHTGEIRSLVTGASGAPDEPVQRIRRSLRSSRTLHGCGDWPTATRTQVVDASSPMTAHQSNPLGLDMVWRSLGVMHRLVGSGPIGREASRTALIAEVGLIADARPLDEWDVAILSAAVGALVGRGSIAYMNGGRVQPLTPREQDVLDLLIEGKSVKQIASEILRSPHTVHDHVKSLHRKLGASSRGELIARALGHAPSRDNCEAGAKLARLAA